MFASIGFNVHKYWLRRLSGGLAPGTFNHRRTEAAKSEYQQKDYPEEAHLSITDFTLLIPGDLDSSGCVDVFKS
jgi:hypothetical protein